MKQTVQRFLGSLGYSLHKRQTIADLEAKCRGLEDRVAILKRGADAKEASGQTDASDARLHRAFSEVALRYFGAGERGPDVAIKPDEVIWDSRPEWVPGMLERQEMHEPEFAIFRFFRNPRSTVLDIGAKRIFGWLDLGNWVSRTHPFIRAQSRSPEEPSPDPRTQARALRFCGGGPWRPTRQRPLRHAGDERQRS
jgi:hypothetical protein